ncbi:hypothetical protein CYMTET_31281, partial [Cymbomonas tetramitiformis]
LILVYEAAGTTLNGNAVIFLQKLGPTITNWFYDTKQDPRLGQFTADFARTIYEEEQFNGVRVPLRAMYYPDWGINQTYPECPYTAHPRSGVVEADAYACTESDLSHIKAASAGTVVYTSLKMAYYEGDDNYEKGFYPPFPDWCLYDESDIETGAWDGKKSSQVKAVAYAELLADHLQYFEARGYTFEYLGVENESGYISANVFVALMTELSRLSQERGFALPGVVAPDFYTPVASWYREVAELGGSHFISVAGTHFYGWEREWTEDGRLHLQEKLIKFKAAVPEGVPLWHTEVHYGTVSKMRHERGENATEMDSIEDLLLQFADYFDLGMTGFVWWAYRSESMQKDDSVKQHVFHEWTDETMGAAPVLVDDHDGKRATRMPLPLGVLHPNPASLPIINF